ncbi:MAG: hypothetical protein LUH15_02780 [Tannerellaceae bacterium]|nr:hypothetical protein [Tannerellaceae bacterium]
MRGEVPFSFEEVALISKRLRISLDQLLDIEMKKQRPFTLQIADFENPTEEDYEIWENYNYNLSQFIQNGSFTTFETWTTIPFPFCYQFYNLTKFYIFKWAFQVNNHTTLKRFDDIELDKKFCNISLKSYDLYQQAISSDYILANFVFHDLIKDIQFFHDLHCLSKENVKLLVQEMEACLNIWEKLTMSGKYNNSERKINVYITDINIDTNYTLIEAQDDFICYLRSFTLNSLVTSEEDTYNYVKNSFHSLKRLSTHISVSGEKERIKYFEKERNMIETLK